MNKSSNTMGAIYITIAAVSWGVFPLFNRTLASLGIPPLASTAVRAMIAAVIYIIWGISKGSFKTFSIKCIPFYLFYAPSESRSRVTGETLYRVYYVPAIDLRYIENPEIFGPGFEQYAD